MKNITTIVLLGFVAVTIIYLVMGDRGELTIAPREVATTAAEPSVVRPEMPKQDKPTNTTQQVTGDQIAVGAEPMAKIMVNTSHGAKSSHKVIAYYFHRTQRCHTCLTMEAYAEQALKEGLSDALESGELEWRAVNVEEAEHEHFVKEYELFASALVIVETDGGQEKQSKKLEQIWDLVSDELKFKAFIQNEVQAYLEAAP